MKIINELVSTTGDNKPLFDATRYRISTITVTGSVNTELDLDKFFDYVQEIIIEKGVNKTSDHQFGIIYAEFGKRRSTTYYTGFSKKFLAQRQKEHVNKRFDNQLTIVFKFNEDSVMNIKVFKNGNIQITGVKAITDGEKMIDALVNYLKSQSGTYNIAKDYTALRTVNYKVALINSDFKVDFEIKRDKLHSTIVNHYDNKCSFEPCIYPGVKIQYFWNSWNHHKDGVCRCHEDCYIGKGDGKGDGNCKKITIAVFQSGCIIITGAQNTEQIDNAYKFICDVFENHLDVIKKVPLPVSVMAPKAEPKNKIILKKSLIIYPLDYVPSISSSTSSKR
jgi:TATA-box binding protein (TBP) (component of TFIID and TFIIIB)